MFRDPVDLEQLYEMPECREAAQIDSEHEFEFEANAPIDSGHESEFETIAQIESEPELEFEAIAQMDSRRELEFEAIAQIKSEPELEFEAIAQKESGRELEFEAIAQTDSEPHLKKRDSLKGVFRDYVRNKQRVVILEKQLRDYSDADLFLPVSIFRPHKGPAGALAELNGLKVLMAEQYTLLLRILASLSTLINKNNLLTDVFNE